MEVVGKRSACLSACACAGLAGEAVVGRGAEEPGDSLEGEGTPNDVILPQPWLTTQDAGAIDGPRSLPFMDSGRNKKETEEVTDNRHHTAEAPEVPGSRPLDVIANIIIAESRH